MLSDRVSRITGVLTGKSLNWGGSLIRPEATGYGAVYFAAEMLGTRNQTLEGKACLETAEQYNTPGNYVNGANIAGFVKVAEAMIDQGIV